MTLDITKISPQIGEMIAKIKSGSDERQKHLKYAADKLGDQSINLEKLKHKIARARTPWPVAQLYEGLGQHFSAPAAPPDYTALATDGSHIDVDRHKAARCYLINVGAVNLHYGQNPAAELTSEPRLYSDDLDLTIKNERNKRREQQIEGALLDARRAVEECRKLAEMASETPEDEIVLALMDGSLVLFSLEAFPDYVVEAFLEKGFLKSLDRLRQVSEKHALTLASYISLPRSADVVNVLKVAICPQEAADCDKNCAESDPACDVISGVNDRLIFANLLADGERSATFINPSTILERYGQHRVYFFYLKLEDEIARIEIPEWVAVRKSLVDLAHSLVLDQCRRGQGYPVALSEAHEQAVVTGADREEFWRLVDQTLEEERLPTYTSVKSQSKRTRYI